MNWLSFEKFAGQKASAIIQGKIHELLVKHDIEPQGLSGVINVNGPGFYTGLRLAEGFSDVLSFFGIKQYSFYSYEIPYWCGVKSGVWFTKAYRGEYFFYHWDQDVSHHELVDSKKLEAHLLAQKYYIHSPSSLDTLSSGLVKSSVSTVDLLYQNPQKVFSYVLKGLKREAFYFRAPEDEFKVNP